MNRKVFGSERSPRRARSLDTSSQQSISAVTSCLGAIRPKSRPWLSSKRPNLACAEDESCEQDGE